MNLSEIAIYIENQNNAEAIRPCKEFLDHFGIHFEQRIVSALQEHNVFCEMVRRDMEKGIKVFITAGTINSGMPHVMAATTHMPVIHIPLPVAPDLMEEVTGFLNPFPEGIAVAIISGGVSGAKNAAVLAAQMLGISDRRLQDRVRFYKQNGCRFV